MPYITTFDKILKNNNWPSRSAPNLETTRERVLAAGFSLDAIPLTFLYQSTPLHLLNIRNASFWSYSREWKIYDTFLERESLRFIPYDWRAVYYVQVLERYAHGMASGEQLREAFSLSYSLPKHATGGIGTAAGIKDFISHPKIQNSPSPEARAIREGKLSPLLQELEAYERQGAEFWLKLFS